MYRIAAASLLLIFQKSYGNFTINTLIPRYHSISLDIKNCHPIWFVCKNDTKT